MNTPPISISCSPRSCGACCSCYSSFCRGRYLFPGQGEQRWHGPQGRRRPLVISSEALLAAAVEEVVAFRGRGSMDQCSLLCPDRELRSIPGSVPTPATRASQPSGNKNRKTEALFVLEKWSGRGDSNALPQPWQTRNCHVETVPWGVFSFVAVC